MALWDDFLHTPSIGGIEIDPTDRRVSGGRAMARRRYPYRGGQEIEDTGREPYTFDLTIPLFDDTGSGDYPAKLEQLRQLSDEPLTQGEVEYVDPLLGPIDCKMVRFDWTESAGERDGAFLSVSLEERINQPFVTSDLETEDPQASAESAAADLDASLSDAGVTEGELVEAWADAGAPLVGVELEFSAGELFLSLSDSFFSFLDGAEHDEAELAAELDRQRARISVLLDFDPMAQPEGWEAWRAGVRLSASMTSAADAIFAALPPVVPWKVPRAMSHYEISVALYRTPDRADEIARRNPSPNPLFFSAGAELSVLAS